MWCRGVQCRAMLRHALLSHKSSSWLNDLGCKSCYYDNQWGPGLHLKCRLIRHIKENAAVREKSFSFAGCTTGSSRDWGSAAAAGTGVFSKMNDLRATFTALILSFSKPQTGYLCKRLVNYEKSQCFSNDHHPCAPLPHHCTVLLHPLLRGNTSSNTNPCV